MELKNTCNMCLPIKKVRPEAIIPKRATQGSAGMDLSACIEKPMVLEPGQRALIPTGIAAAIPPGAAGMIYARSSLGVRHGVALSNGVGVVDSDYRGEIQVGLCNFSSEPFTIQPGERIAQLVLHPVLMPEVCEVEELDDTLRGEGGFGSTGRL